jgi:uncharacterized protein YhbP (UPF0306 family)
LASLNLLPLSDLLELPALTLATSGEAREPHAAAVYFVADDSLGLYFFSASSSQHSLDLERDPRAAVSIYLESRSWQEIRGLQMRGEVHQVEPGAAWERAWHLYLSKFPFVSEMKAEIARTRLYVFQPDWIRLIDNGQGFGFKQEWVRGQDAGSGMAGWRSGEAGG